MHSKYQYKQGSTKQHSNSAPSNMLLYFLDESWSIKYINTILILSIMMQGKVEIANAKSMIFLSKIPISN